jgi:hypothetical protein
MPTLRLNCWVLDESLSADDDPKDRVFSIEIDDTKNVSALKDMVHHYQALVFTRFSPNELDLYKISIAADANLGDRIRTILPIRHDPENGVKKLSPLELLSVEFAEMPDHMNLHVIVRTPATGEPK